jgi:predicted CoA-binding protein
LALLRISSILSNGKRLPIGMVMDRCLMKEHKRMVGERS